MGMYNAILDDELLKPLGIHKERLSQSALFAEMRRVPDEEAAAVRAWLDAEGMTFKTGTDEATELTDAQLHEQFKMYIADLRISDDFGLDAVGRGPDAGRTFLESWDRGSGSVCGPRMSVWAQVGEAGACSDLRLLL